MQRAQEPHQGRDLPPGQQKSLFVPAGAEVHVLAGRLELQEPPRWLAERIVCATRQIGAGQRHVIDERGWLRLRAAPGAAATRFVVAAPGAPGVRDEGDTSAWMKSNNAFRPWAWFSRR